MKIATAAAAGCVKAGISVFLDPYAAQVKDALDKNLITEADIEHDIKGNLRMRMRLGEFDPPEMVPYNKIAGTEEPWLGDKNKALARKATQESIVLLKNSPAPAGADAGAENLLPLDKTMLKSIAVIGPSANEVFIDWYAGNLPYAVTPLEGIRNKVGPGVRVRYVLITTSTAPRRTWRRNPTWRLYSWATTPPATRPLAEGARPAKARKR